MAYTGRFGRPGGGQALGVRRNPVLASLLVATLALGAGCGDDDGEDVDGGDGGTSTTLDDGTEAGTPSGEVGEVEGDGDAVEGEGTESDDEGPGGASDEGDDSGGGATGSGGDPED